MGSERRGADSHRERTVLVTGAQGFAGRHLVARLAREPGVRVVALGSPPAAVDVDPSRVTHLPRRLQALDAQAWRELRLTELDCVFHLAAFTPKAAGEEELDGVWAGNLDGTRSLLASLPATRRIVYASTLDVYGPAPGETVTEQTATAPATLYAASKLFCESLVRWHGRRHGVETVVLRYGHLFGPGEDAYDKLIPRTIRRLLAGRPPGIHGDGSACRDLLYVGDAAEATVRAGAAHGADGRVLNVVRGESVTIAEVVSCLVDLTGYIGPVRRYPARADAASLRFDASAMRAVLGRWPLTSLAGGLRAEVDDVASRLLAPAPATAVVPQ